MPVPLAPVPIAVLLLVHVYTFDAEPPVNVLAGTIWLAHTELLVTGFTLGVGFTRIVKLCDEPVHPFLDGVTVTVAVCAADVLLLVPVNVGMLPTPLVARPMVASLLAHVNVVAITLPLKLVAATAVLLHTAWLGGTATSGVG